MNTLRRYKRHYKLQTRPGLNKAQLAEVQKKLSHCEDVLFCFHKLVLENMSVLQEPFQQYKKRTLSLAQFPVQRPRVTLFNHRGRVRAGLAEC